MQKKPAKSTNPESHYISAREAVKILNVKPQTLYAYVSRGWIRSIEGPHARERLYLKVDVDKVRARQRARSGHGPTAASAMRWGEPILETSITEIAHGTLRYRNRDVIQELVLRHVSFENTSELLWSGVLPEIPVHWQPSVNEALWREAFTAAKSYSDPKTRIAAFVSRLALEAWGEHDQRPDQIVHMCRTLYPTLAALVSSADLQTIQAAQSIAGILQRGWQINIPEAADYLNQALVLCADHELNTSAFVARVTASNGAGPLLCLEAALAAHRGTLQGLTADRLEEFLEANTPSSLAANLAALIARRSWIPGFGHPLYPDGDPRGSHLWALALHLKSKDPRMTVLKATAEWIQEHQGYSPNLDGGLLALSISLGLPAKSASSLFTMARITGWVAHVMEQRAQGFQIRPRAKYLAR